MRQTEMLLLCFKYGNFVVSTHTHTCAVCMPCRLHTSLQPHPALPVGVDSVASIASVVYLSVCLSVSLSYCLRLSVCLSGCPLLSRSLTLCVWQLRSACVFERSTMKPSLLHFNFMILRFFMLAPSHSGAAKAPPLLPPYTLPLSLLPVPVALVCHVACGMWHLFCPGPNWSRHFHNSSEAAPAIAAASTLSVCLCVCPFNIMYVCVCVCR